MRCMVRFDEEVTRSPLALARLKANVAAYLVGSRLTIRMVTAASFPMWRARSSYVPPVAIRTMYRNTFSLKFDEIRLIDMTGRRITLNRHSWRMTALGLSVLVVVGYFNASPVRCIKEQASS